MHIENKQRTALQDWCLRAWFSLFSQKQFQWFCQQCIHDFPHTKTTDRNLQFKELTSKRSCVKTMENRRQVSLNIQDCCDVKAAKWVNLRDKRPLESPDSLSSLWSQRVIDGTSWPTCLWPLAEVLTSICPIVPPALQNRNEKDTRYKVPWWVRGPNYTRVHLSVYLKLHIQIWQPDPVSNCNSAHIRSNIWTSLLQTGSPQTEPLIQYARSKIIMYTRQVSDLQDFCKSKACSAIRTMKGVITAYLKAYSHEGSFDTVVIVRLKGVC